MTKNNEQQRIVEGIALGNQVNNAVADKVAANAAKMLSQSLSEKYATLLQAKMNVAVQATLNEHTAQIQAHAKQFLSQSKTKLAGSIMEVQHQNQLQQLTTNLNLTELDSFDCDLLPEVTKMANEEGAIVVEVSTENPVGFA